MSDNTDETMAELFERGLTLRREVLGAEYVDKSMSSANDFMMAFQRAMEQLGLSNKVTAFTASDFGRTFPGNGSGSDGRGVS